MSDQYKAAGFTGSAQVQPSAPATDAQTPAQPQYLTRDEAEAMAKAAEEAAFRRAQGLIEKSSSRVLKQVQTDLKALETSLALQRKAGIEVTPEMEDRLKQQVMQKAFQDAPVEEVVPIPSAPVQEAGQPVDRSEDPAIVNAQAWGLMEGAGIFLEDGDEELNMLVRNSTGKDFIDSMKAAIEHKRQRNAASNINPAVRVAGAVQGTGKPDLMQAYLKEVDSATNQSQRLDIRRKYRNLGLQL